MIAANSEPRRLRGHVRTGTLYLFPPRSATATRRKSAPSRCQVLALSRCSSPKTRAPLAHFSRQRLPASAAGSRVQGARRAHPGRRDWGASSTAAGWNGLRAIVKAGCPAVADPGAALVRIAHDHDVRVVPLVGPSSILLALMASGWTDSALRSTVTCRRRRRNAKRAGRTGAGFPARAGRRSSSRRPIAISSYSRRFSMPVTTERAMSRDRSYPGNGIRSDASDSGRKSRPAPNISRRHCVPAVLRIVGNQKR